MEKILKKIEEARTQKYISSLRLKELKNIKTQMMNQQ